MPGVHKGVFAALGAFGQFIYVNPAEQAVVAIQSARRQLQDVGARVETVAFLRAAVRALHSDEGRSGA